MHIICIGIIVHCKCKYIYTYIDNFWLDAAPIYRHKKKIKRDDSEMARVRRQDGRDIHIAQIAHLAIHVAIVHGHTGMGMGNGIGTGMGMGMGNGNGNGQWE